MGRASISLTRDEFLDVLRGAKLTVFVDTTFADRPEGQTYTPAYQQLDLFGDVRRVVFVEFYGDDDTVEIVMDGPGLPAWHPKQIPMTLTYALSRWAEEPAPYRTRRAIDPESL
jgi:hypothetical protein